MPSQERRAAARHKIQVAAELQSGDGTSRVRLLNISRGGLMLETGGPLSAGERIRVIADGVRTPQPLSLVGTVVWRSTTLAGVKFELALSEEDLRALLG